jgi:TonB family protein
MSSSETQFLLLGMRRSDFGETFVSSTLVLKWWRLQVDMKGCGMRRTKWRLALIAFSASCIWAQQQTPSSGPVPVSPKSTAGTVGQRAEPADKGTLQLCPAEMTGKEDGVYEVGGDIKPPKPLNNVEAHFTKELRTAIKKQHLPQSEAVSVVSLLVDTDGNPKNICVQKAGGYGMDEEATKAAAKYRFQPATKDGKPVPVRIPLIVRFRLY